VTDKTKKLKKGWQPGQSGNPAGRAAGSINASTRLRKMIDAEAIVKRLQEAALDGDVQAARTLLERALPVYRTSAEPVSLPELNKTSELGDKAKVILAAVGAGELPPDIGSQLVAAVGAVAGITRVDELAKRIEVLENRNAKS
jgi:hypothetical protein